MKKFLSVLLAVMSAAVACNDDMVLTPGASLATESPIVEDECAIFRIALNNYSAAEAVTFPVTFGGDAVKGEDYSVSTEAFICGGDEPVTEITVTALKFGTGRKMSVSLGLPEGWTGGKYLVSEYELPDNLGYLSFERDTLYMTDSLDVTLKLYDADGGIKKLVKGGDVTVSVDTVKSTAIEGTDFRFKGDRKVVIAPGTGYGIVSLEHIGEDADPEHNKIVLSFQTGDRYGTGQYAETEIIIEAPESDSDSGSDSDTIEG